MPDHQQPERAPYSGLLAISKVVLCGIVVGIPWLYPPIGILKIVGLVAWFRLVGSSTRGPLRAFGDGVLIGCISLGIAFHWARESISDTTHLTGVLSYLVWGALVLWEAIPFGLISLVIHRCAGRWTMLGVPFVWALLELYWPRIFPWSVAHVFLEWLPLVQLAQLGGQALVTAVVLWFVSGTVLLWQRYDRLRAAADEAAPAGSAEQSPQTAAKGGIFTGAAVFSASLRRIALATVLPVIAIVGYGGWLLAATRDADARAAEVRVAALQVDPSYAGAIERLGELSDSLPDDVDLVCWPESTLGFFAEDLRSFADPVEVIGRAKLPCDAAYLWPAIHCDLLAGAKTYRKESEDGPYRNVAYLINEQKEILNRYFKRDLMPIGEYVPGEQWFPVLREWAALEDVLLRGQEPVALQLSSGPTVGVMICYEDMVADNAIESVHSGAEVLVALINASQFSSPYTLLQHERLARLRAVETQRWVVRCGATGRTCVIAPTGQLIDSVPIQAEGVLVGDVKTREQLSLYARFPNWFPALCGIIAVGVLLSGRRARRVTDKFWPDV